MSGGRTPSRPTARPGRSSGPRSSCPATGGERLQRRRVVKASVVLLARVVGGLLAVAGGGLLGYRLALPPEPPTPSATPAALPPAVPTPPAGRSSPRHALLVGVTRYDHLPGRELEGPGRDVALVREVLLSRFGFDPADIVSPTDAE